MCFLRFYNMKHETKIIFLSNIDNKLNEKSNIFSFFLFQVIISFSHGTNRRFLLLTHWHCHGI